MDRDSQDHGLLMAAEIRNGCRTTTSLWIPTLSLTSFFLHFFSLRPPSYFSWKPTISFLSSHLEIIRFSFSLTTFFCFCFKVQIVYTSSAVDLSPRRNKRMDLDFVSVYFYHELFWVELTRDFKSITKQDIFSPGNWLSIETRRHVVNSTQTLSSRHHIWFNCFFHLVRVRWREPVKRESVVGKWMSKEMVCMTWRGQLCRVICHHNQLKR